MRDYGLSRILIVDLDVHQGNGTSSIFELDKRVVTFDMHGAPKGGALDELVVAMYQNLNVKVEMQVNAQFFVYLKVS